MLKRRVLTESSKYGPQSGSAQSDKGPSIRERKLESDLDWLKKEKIDGQRKSSGVGKGGNKRRNVWIFTLGGIFGLLIAGLVAKRSDMIDLSVLGGSHFESLLEVLPAALVRDAKELQQHERDVVNYDSFSVGLHARLQGIQADHPVVMIPGVISTGLESWGTEEQTRPYFRKRLWGSWTMMRALIMDKQGWKRHIMLDKQTGLDPAGIKLRAAQGFDATDFFITGYWIWNKIVENLATIGYDPSNAFTAAYDWRLSYMNMERRDQYFSRLKMQIELAATLSGKKVVLLSHSMGSQVLYYFLHWVEADGHGNGGPAWADRYVHAWINISGCMLGALKGLPALLSGEMRDTAQLNAFAVYGLEKFLSRHERAEIFRTMPGISSMLPLGGDAVWGNASWAPDDAGAAAGQPTSFGAFLNFRADDAAGRRHVNLTVNEALEHLRQHSESWYAHALQENYAHGAVARSEAAVERNQREPAMWINPLATRLPLAPKMTIYCFYGTGKPTERAYFYRQDTSDPLAYSNYSIDTALNDAYVDHGVIMGEGDGTVNLLSMGYMCSRGWHIRRFNPAGVRIKVVEMPHEPDRFSSRGGPNTGDHVDILGRSSLNELILRVAGGKGESIENNIVSNILDYASKVKVDDHDG